MRTNFNILNDFLLTGIESLTPRKWPLTYSPYGGSGICLMMASALAYGSTFLFCALSRLGPAVMAAQDGITVLALLRWRVFVEPSVWLHQSAHLV